MFKQIYYKTLCIENFDEICKKNHTMALTQKKLFYLFNTYVYEYDLETNATQNLKISAEKLFTIHNILITLNKTILTVYYNKTTHVKQYNLENGYRSIKITNYGIIFIYPTHLMGIILEDNSIISFKQTQLFLNNIIDVDISEHYIYILLQTQLYKIKKSILNIVNKIEILPDSEIIKINEFTSIKKYVISILVNGKLLWTTNNGVIIVYDDKIIKYKISNDNFCHEEFTLLRDDKFMPIQFYDGGYLLFNNQLIEINTVPIKILSFPIITSFKNKFLSHNKIYYINNIANDTVFHTTDLENISTINNLIDNTLYFNPETIQYPDYLSDNEKELFMNFKLKVEKWKKIIEEFNKRVYDRKIIINELESLKHNIKIELEKYNVKKQKIKNYVINLTNKAQNVKLEDSIKKSILDINKKLDSLQNKQLKTYYTKLKIQQETLKDLLRM